LSKVVFLGQTKLIKSGFPATVKVHATIFLAIALNQGTMGKS